MSKSESEWKQDEHNRGQEAGANSNVLADAIRDLTPIGWIGKEFFESKEYVKGYENGQKNKASDSK
jgi:hypothetical protein